jgi:hypothetical protein
MSPIGPSRHTALPHELGRYRSKADVATSHMTPPSLYTAFCKGPDDVKPPGERLVAELMLLSVVNAWPPHHAVRGSGEPI